MRVGSGCVTGSGSEGVLERKSVRKVLKRMLVRVDSGQGV